MIVQTHKKDEVIDITDVVEEEVKIKKALNGICIVFVKHTTCAVTTADLDPGTDLDLLDSVRAMLPKMQYRHPHNPPHAPDHLISSIIGPSVSIPIVNGQLTLDVWQRIILIELDGPKNR